MLPWGKRRIDDGAADSLQMQRVLVTEVQNSLAAREKALRDSRARTVMPAKR